MRFPGLQFSKFSVGRMPTDPPGKVSPWTYFISISVPLLPPPPPPNRKITARSMKAQLYCAERDTLTCLQHEGQSGTLSSVMLHFWACVNIVAKGSHKLDHDWTQGAIVQNFYSDLTGTPMIITAYLSWSNVRMKVYLVFKMKYIKYRFLKGIHSVTWS